MSKLIAKLSSFSIKNPMGEFEQRLFFKEAKKLKKIEPVEGWVVEGIIYALVDNDKDCVQVFEKALALQPHDKSTVINYSTALWRLGFFQLSYDIVKKHLYDNPALLSDAFHISIEIGLFKDAIIHQKKLEKMNHTTSFDFLNRGKNYCEALKINFNDINQIFICTLETIHASKENTTCHISIEPEPPQYDSLTIFFGINADGYKLAEIECALYERLAKLNIPSVDAQKILPVICYYA